MASVAYAFYRYELTDLEKNPIPGAEHLEVFRKLTARFVPHRVRNPGPNDYDTFIMRFEQQRHFEYECLVFDIARKVDFRIAHAYDADKDELVVHELHADDTEWTHVILVPAIGRAAVRDGSGSLLSANSGASRVQSVIRELTNLEFSYNRTATTEEIEKAVSRLAITEFSFRNRPFNPHPDVPGDKLDELLKRAEAYDLSGKASPAPGHTMSVAEDGLISESIGLAQKGYGQYGFKAVTATGVQVAFQKPQMRDTREENLRERKKNSVLKVVVPEDDDEYTEEEFIVSTMLEIFNGR